MILAHTYFLSPLVKKKPKYYELIPLGTPLLQHFVAIQLFDNIKLYSGYNFNLMAKGKSS